MWDYSYLEVRYTSTPLSNSSGIWDITLDDYSELLYLDGLTEEITLYDDAKAYLKGGRIDGITSRQYTSIRHIDLYCQPDWEWLYNTSSEIEGITGLWETGTAFTIDFIDDQDYDPVWENINIIEIPEPATILLLGLGMFLARKQRG